MQRQNKKVERVAYEELRQFREDCKEREAGDRAGGAGRGQTIHSLCQQIFTECPVYARQWGQSSGPNSPKVMRAF